MSFQTLRAAIVQTVRDVAPSSKIGANSFTEIRSGDVDNADIDRGFAVRVVDPPQQVGGNINLVTWRFRTTVEVVIKYIGRSQAATDVAIADDAMSLQKALLTPSNLGSDFGAYIPQGDGHITATVDDDNAGAVLLTLTLVLVHK